MHASRNSFKILNWWHVGWNIFLKKNIEMLTHRIDLGQPWLTCETRDIESDKTMESIPKHIRKPNYNESSTEGQKKIIET